MKLTKLILIYYSLMCIFFSCGSDAEKRRNKLEKKKNDETAKLVKKNNAIILDSINTYTFSCQEKFITQNNLLAFVGSISDIIKTDTSYILQAYYTRWDKNYLAHISIDTIMFQKLTHLLQFNFKRRQKGCFIIKISEIVSKNPSVELDLHTNSEENDAYVTMGNFGSGRILIFKGVLVDYFIIEPY